MVSDEIKEKINIVDIVGERVQLKKAGTNFRGLCPFHSEKTPSFMVSPAKQIWHCFGCGLGGDIFEFVKQSEGVDFMEAMEILASRAGIVLRRPEGGISYSPDQKKALYEINNWAALYYAKVLAESRSAQGARDYLQKRGLKPETIKKWQIGYAPDGYHAFEEFIIKKGYTRQEATSAGLIIKKDDGTYFDRFHDRVMFPLHDLHGRVVGFTGRILKEQENTGKYVNSPETLIYNKSRLLYGLNFAKSEIRKKDEVIIVEGNLDVITCHEAGFNNVVGLSGTSRSNEFQIEVLRRFTNNFVIAMDFDTAGEDSIRRVAELPLSLGLNLWVVQIPQDIAKDPDELIRKDPILWEKAVNNKQLVIDFYLDRKFANMNTGSPVDKKVVDGFLIPLIALLPNSIDRQHYIKKLAIKIEDDEREVLNRLNNFKSQQKQPLKAVDTKTYVKKLTKQEILEARVLGLILKFSEELGQEWQAFQETDFSTQTHREIFRCLAEQAHIGPIERERLAAEHPNLATDIELLVFGLENEMALGEASNVGSWKENFFGQFRLSVIRKHMQEITAAMRNAETAGQAELVKNLSLEFNHLAGELSKFHQ